MCFSLKKQTLINSFIPQKHVHKHLFLVIVSKRLRTSSISTDVLLTEVAMWGKAVPEARYLVQNQHPHQLTYRIFKPQRSPAYNLCSRGRQILVWCIGILQ